MTEEDVDEVHYDLRYFLLFKILFSLKKISISHSKSKDIFRVKVILDREHFIAFFTTQLQIFQNKSIMLKMKRFCSRNARGLLF